MIDASNCPSCHTAVSASANFCSQCGKKLKEPLLSLSVARQTLIYFVSLFLAPFGLRFAFKYLKQPTAKARAVGIVSVVLTVLAVVLAVVIVWAFFGSLYGSLMIL